MNFSSYHKVLWTPTTFLTGAKKLYFALLDVLKAFNDIILTAQMFEFSLLIHMIYFLSKISGENSNPNTEESLKKQLHATEQKLSYFFHVVIGIIILIQSASILSLFVGEEDSSFENFVTKAQNAFNMALYLLLMLTGGGLLYLLNLKQRETFSLLGTFMICFMVSESICLLLNIVASQDPDFENGATL